MIFYRILPIPVSMGIGQSLDAFLRDGLNSCIRPPIRERSSAIKKWKSLTSQTGAFLRSNAGIPSTPDALLGEC